MANVLFTPTVLSSKTNTHFIGFPGFSTRVAFVTKIDYNIFGIKVSRLFTSLHLLISIAIITPVFPMKFFFLHFHFARYERALGHAY